MKIEDIKVRRILDSRGEETIEVEILSEGLKEKASVPIGKSLGKHEAICLDCEKIEKNLLEFLKNIRNLDFKNSKDFDNFLIEGAGKNKEKLGANFTLGASIAFVRVLAKKKGLELWEYLEKEYLPELNDRMNYPNNGPNEIFGKHSGNKFGPNSGSDMIFGGNSGNIFGQHSGKLPGLIINIIGGGVHSFNNLDFQEYWLITYPVPESHTRVKLGTGSRTELRSGSGQSTVQGKRLDRFNELLAKILNIINKLEEKLPKPLGRNDEGAFCTNFSDNYEPFVYLKEFKNDFELGADIAANQITKLVNWKRIYEKLKLLDVKYLEDPFKEDEFENFANLRKQGFKVIGDDLTVTNVERLKIALEKNSVDGVIVKPNQVGTILETFEFVKLAKENNLFTIFSHRSGETNDDWLIDLGIAFKADFFKIGPPLQGERVAKYNRLREILEKF
jgi:enolase